MSKIKGFTLFTALVGFIIIGIGVLVIQHMSNSEQNYQSLLNSLLTQQEMDSSIHILKLDAISSFDLIYRSKFYDFYKDKGQTGISIITDSSNWEDYKAKYIKETFGVDITQEDVSENSNKVSGFVTSKLLSLLVGYKGSYKGGTYNFTIYDYYYQSTSTNPINISDLSQTASLTGTQLAKSINQSSSNSDFLNILDCKDRSCERGSFYTNFDFTKIDYSLYLNLPRILILNTLDKSQIDDAILPYSKLSIYVPMRLFGAFKLAYDTIEDFSNNELSQEYGDDFPDCGSIDSLDKLNSIEITTFESIADEIKHDYSIRNNYDFDTSILEITENRKFPTEIMLVKIYDQSLKSYQKYKVSSINIELKITDNDLFENVGRMPLTYLLTGTQEVNINDSKSNPQIIYCYCQNESGASGEDPLICEDDKTKFTPTDILTKIEEAFGDSGLTDEAKRDLATKLSS
jgi:hypothetical protein